MKKAFLLAALCALISTQINADPPNPENILFNGEGISIYYTDNSFSSSDFVVVTQTPLPNAIISSTQFRSGPMNEAYINSIRESGFFGTTTRTVSRTVEFQVLGESRVYVYGEFNSNGRQALSNVTITWRSAHIANEVDDEALSVIVGAINDAGQRNHAMSSVGEFVHEQMINNLETFCDSLSRSQQNPFVPSPHWESDRCVFRFPPSDTPWSDLYAFHWSVDSLVVSCRDDMSSCDYTTQIICNGRESGGGISEYCNTLPVQNGTIPLR